MHSESSPGDGLVAMIKDMQRQQRKLEDRLTLLARRVAELEAALEET